MRSIAVVVPYKDRQPRQRLFKLSLFGDGMLERVRSTSLGLLGLAAAVGVALIATVAFQGWPDFRGSPLPERTAAPALIHDARIVASSGPTGPVGKTAGKSKPASGAASTFAPQPGPSASPPGPELAGTDQVVAPVSSPPFTPVPVDEQPSAVAPSPPADVRRPDASEPVANPTGGGDGGGGGQEGEEGGEAGGGGGTGQDQGGGDQGDGQDQGGGQGKGGSQGNGGSQSAGGGQGKDGGQANGPGRGNGAANGNGASKGPTDDPPDAVPSTAGAANPGSDSDEGGSTNSSDHGNAGGGHGKSSD